MRDLVFTVVFALLIPVCFLRPWVGVLVWSWIGFMNPHRLTWSFASTLPVAMIVAVATLLGLLVSRDRKMVPGTPEMVILGLMVITYTVTSALAMVPDAAWAKWNQVMKILLMTFVTTIVIYGRQRIRALLLTITLSIAFYGIKGGMFTLRSGGVSQVRGPDGSFIADNNSLGLAFIMVTPVLFALAREETSKWGRMGLFAAAMLTGLSTVFTYSRGALLGLAAIVFVMLLQAKRKFLALVVVATSAGFLLWFTPQQLYDRAETIQTYEQDRSSMQRVQAWSVAWNLAIQRPLTGGGFWIEYLPDDVWLSYADRAFDEFGNVARSAHSIYFQVLGDHGFIGFALFVMLIVVTLRSLQKLKRTNKYSTPEARWVGAYANGLQIGVIGYCVAGAFLSLGYFDLFYAYVALAAILSREAAALKGPAKQSDEMQVKVSGKVAPFS
jgi:probable O-glycosylation ligase (exosortase A-associated)